MTIYDYWSNPLIPVPIQVIGYKDAIEDFPHDLYSFLLSTIREQDQEGTALLWRWLQPMQQMWESQYASILAVPYLKSPSECPISLIDYLRKDIGIMDDMDYIWSYLTDLEKRKFIKFFVRFLKFRSTGFGLDEMIETMTGLRVEIQNYFDFRWIVSGDSIYEMETALGREDDRYDSWMLSECNMESGGIPDEVIVTSVSGMTFYNFILTDFVSKIANPPVPQWIYIKHIGMGEGEYALLYTDGTDWRAITSPDYIFGQSPSSLTTTVSSFRVAFESDEYVFDVIVEDDGTLNRDMVVGLAKFSRPQSERIYVRYYNFVELFKSFDRWDEISGTATWSESNQNVVLSDVIDDTVIQINLSDALNWVSYGLHVKMQHSVHNEPMQIRFMVQDTTNFYYLRLISSEPPTIPAGTWNLRRVVAGVDVLLDSGNLEWFDIDVDYMWRIESVTVDRPGGQVQVMKLYQDENLLATVIDNPAPWGGNVKGTVEIMVDHDNTLIVSRVLIHPIPMESDYVGP